MPVTVPLSPQRTINDSSLLSNSIADEVFSPQTVTCCPVRRRSSRRSLSCRVEAAAGHLWQASDIRMVTVWASTQTSSIVPPCDWAGAPIGPASSSAAIAASWAVSSGDASTRQPAR
jgi:hypothetical protein